MASKESRISAEGDSVSSNHEKTQDLGPEIAPPPQDPVTRVLSRPIDEDSIVYPGPLRLAVILVAVCLAVFLVALDRLIIVTAIPKITDHFNSLTDIGWYGSAYLLTMCAFQLFYGKIYEYFSLKATYITAIGLFELGSLVCATAPSSNAFIVGRAIAGLGCAGIWSGALVILAYSIPIEKRAAYTGVVGSMFGIASIVGPILGGAFSDSHLTWRWCFYINLPVAVPVILIILCFFEAPKRIRADSLTWREKVDRLDLFGLLLFLPAIVSLLLALQWGGSKYPWSNGRIIALLVVFSILIIAFGALQLWKGETGTLPPRILKNRTVMASFWFSITITGGFLAIGYFMPVWFQAIKGTTAITSGIRTLPMTMGVVIGSMIGGAISSMIGLCNPFLIGGPILLSVGAGLLTTLKRDSGHPAWIGYQVLSGLGIGVCFQLPIIATQAAVSIKDVSVASAVTVFAQSFGGAIFISVGQTTLNQNLISGITKAVPDLPNAARIVLETGAVNIKRVFETIEGGRYLDAVLTAYSHAVTRVFFIPVGLGVASFLLAFAFEWINVKKAKAKSEKKVEETVETSAA